MNRTAVNEARMDESRLERLMEVIRDDIDRDRYFGAVIAIGRHGHLVLHDAIGHADSAHKRPVKKDSVFSLFSTTKAITVVLVLRAIERGQLALTTPISEVVPEFSGRGREAITIFHLLYAFLRPAERVVGPRGDVHRPARRSRRRDLQEHLPRRALRA